ncbi:MAG: sulfotransferase family protein [Boseongicola sp.]
MTEIFRPVALSVQRLFNQLDPATAGEDPSLVDAEFPPVFLIGPPRSGSTLVYQALCRAANVCFISNTMALLPRFMGRLAPWSLSRAPTSSSPYPRGDYGFLPGLFAPSEAGKVFDGWFSDDNRFDQSDVRRMIAGLSRRVDRPLLVKSPSLILRLDQINNMLPYARFIVLSRTPAFIVQSLLEGQSNQALSDDRWEGISPPMAVNRTFDGPEDKTAWQVAELLRSIELNMADVDASRISRVSYEDFCEDPRGCIDQVGRDIGIVTNSAKLPSEFSVSSKIRVSPELWRKLEEACRRHNLGVVDSPV